jgi:hypothetical protein
MHLDPYQKRLLTEAEPLPADVVGRLADQAIDRYERLTRDGHPAGEALWPPVEDPAAADRAAAEGLAGRAGMVVAAASGLPFRAGSFDAIVHTDVLC